MSSVALNTKIQAMRSRALTEDDYRQLAASRNVGEIGKLLNAYEGYAELFDAFTDENLSRHSIERSLARSLFADYRKISTFATDFTFKAFFEAFFLDNEIRIIKTMLGMVKDERGEGIPEEVMALLPFDCTRLAASVNVREFIANLEGTRYYSVLKYLSGDVGLFQLEMQLDLYYYMNLYSKCKVLNGKEMTRVKDIIGTQIDLRNIMWVYRFKRYYLFEPSGIYPFLIPVHYKLRADDLRGLVSSTSIESQSVLNERLIPFYRNVFKEDVTLENGYYKKMSEVYKKAAANSTGAVITAMAYVFDKGLEINNLTTITEGVRYGLPPEEIMSHLHL